MKKATTAFAQKSIRVFFSVALIFGLAYAVDSAFVELQAKNVAVADEYNLLQPLADVSTRAELQAAIDNAVADTTINLTSGYTHDATVVNFNSSFNITIDGTACNFGTVPVVFYQNGSGDIVLKNLKFTGASQTALKLTAANAARGSYKLEGCTFQNITCDSSDPKTGGGALRLETNVNASVTNCLFQNNHGNPGALFAGYDTRINLSNSSFIGNRNSTSGGGAIFIAGGIGGSRASLTIDRCHFSGNYSNSANGQSMQGGAIHATSISTIDIVVKDSVFADNERRTNADTTSGGNCDGGAIAIRNVGGSDAAVKITGSNFIGNHAGDDGGAILLEGNLTSANLTASIANCTFTDNYAGYNATYPRNEGGGISFYGMLDSEITHCTFYNNKATTNGGAVALSTGTSAGATVPRAPILSNNIFIANTAAPTTGNVSIITEADAGRTKNNGNVGYDNGGYGYTDGQNAGAKITVENVFAQTTGAGTTAVPTRTYFGTAVGASNNTAQRFCYIPSPLTDEMYRDGSGPYYDAAVRQDTRGYSRDYYPNAGAVEIYWTKFDPNTAIGGTWVSGAVPTGAIRSIASPDIFYLVTDPSPDNKLITFPRASIDITNPTAYSFQYWESNQPVDPTAVTPAYPHVNPATQVSSTKQTYKAIWTANPANFRVDFNLQYDVSGLPQFLRPQFVAAGGKALQPTPNPTRTDYVFDGWYANAGCTTAWSFATNTISKDTTIYAKWLTPPEPIQTYKVTYYGNKATSGSAPAQSIHNVSETHTVKAQGSLARTNYRFVGWSEDSKATTATYVVGNTIDNVSRDYDLYAVWVKKSTPPSKSYDVIYYGNKNSSGQAPSSVTVSAGSDHKVKSAGSLARSGYSFIGWSETASASTASYVAGDTIDDIRRDYELYAIWRASGSQLPTTNPPTTDTPDEIADEPDVATPDYVQPQVDPQPQPQQPDVATADANEQTLKTIQADGMPTINIGGQDVPLLGFGYSGVWSLFNLILLILTILIAIYRLVRLAISDKKDLTNRYSSLTIAVVAIVLLSLVVFVLTEDTNLLMVVFDSWSPCMAALIIIQVILVAITKKAPPTQASR